MNDILYKYLLEEILEHYDDIEDTIIHARERQGEWEDPTYDKANKLVELSQKVHGL